MLMQTFYDQMPMNELSVFAFHHGGGKKWYYCRSEGEMKSMFKNALVGISTEDCRIE